MLGDLVIDYAARRVSVAGRAVHMTPIEYELMFELSVNAGTGADLRRPAGPGLGPWGTRAKGAACAPT